MMQLEDLYLVPPPRCAFFGGPWGGRVMVMPDARPMWLAPVPVPFPVTLFDIPQTPMDSLVETAVYRLRGVDDDGTRRYYLDA